MCNLQGDKIDRRVCMFLAQLWHFLAKSSPFPLVLGFAGEVFFNSFLMCFHLRLCVALGFGFFPSVTSSFCFSRGFSGDTPQNYGINILGRMGAFFPVGQTHSPSVHLTDALSCKKN